MQKEINKLLKQLSAAKLQGKHKDCIDLNNIIGGLYSEIGSYEEAIHYHEEALDLSKTLGERLNKALCHRYIGEGKASLGLYEEAIRHIEIYVELAQKINDKVEIQRAWTTLGRIYLMQAQSLHEAEKSSTREKTKKTLAREAEKHFQTALNMAESVRNHIDDKEYCSMICGLLINMAIIKDLQGQRQEAIVKFNRAAETCRVKKLKEDLYRCYSIASPIYRRWYDTKMAIKASEEALKIAKSIGKKILICEALIELGLTRIWQRDFKNAKRTFAQAYLEKSPSEDDHLKAVKLTKLSHLISTNYEKLTKETTASESRMKLCDKLGDLFVAVGNYHLASEYYKQAFLSAKACSMPRSERARLLFSVAECFADSEQYQFALACFGKEVALREGNPREQSPTYIKMAHMMEYLEKSSEEVCDCYEKALASAEKDPKLMYNVLRWYVPYLEQKTTNVLRMRELQEMLTNVKSYPEVAEEAEEEHYEEADELEDEIADVDDVITDDEDNDEVLMAGRRRAKGSNRFKQNEVGDTPLHEAAIKGDLKRVKSLVSQGHEVNPRDNAGWIPLHESCNHGHYSIAEYLIEKGADVNNRGLKGVTPLHDAATNGHYDIMRLLMKNGANVLTLTDTGESAITCLRDYKTRNQKTMSNSEMSEYKQMEAELLNIMDKCGYNLMTENTKQSKSNTSTYSSYARPHTALRSYPQAEPALIPPSSSKLTSGRSIELGGGAMRSAVGSVKEYRDAMGTLKRKRPLEVNQPSKKISQPATIKANYDPSVATKHWLQRDDEIIEEDEEEDEDNEEEEDVIIAAQRRGALRNERPNMKAASVIEEDDEQEVQFVREQKWPDMEKNNSNLDEPPVVNLYDDDSTPASVSSKTKDQPAREIESATPMSVDSTGLTHFNPEFNYSARTPYAYLDKPLKVTICDRRLLIPIKNEHVTIRELKNAIVDRYSILVDARPMISLAPISDQQCILFDDDLCKDVIREDLIASITAWQIPSMVDSYVQHCEEQKVTPIDFIKAELRGLSDMGPRPDLSYIRLPAAHRQAFAQALARRDFATVDLQGSVGLFEKHQLLGCDTQRPHTLMDSVITWSQLTRLNLRCTGLLRVHFEHLCSIKPSTLPELEDLDVSFNSIIYKKQDDLAAEVDKLHKSCAKLKRIDLSRNLLRFLDLFPEQKRADNCISEHIKVIL